MHFNPKDRKFTGNNTQVIFVAVIWIIFFAVLFYYGATHREEATVNNVRPTSATQAAKFY